MRSVIAAPAEPGIRLRRRFRFPPHRVFRAWTQPEALRRWWCPPGWASGQVAVDLRVGGAYRIGMCRPETGAAVAVCGEFLEVRPPERLRYTWRWEGAFASMPETVVTVEFAEADGGTELTLRHEQFIDAGARQQHRSGWIAACNRLDRALPAPGAGSQTRPARWQR